MRNFRRFTASVLLAALLISVLPLKIMADEVPDTETDITSETEIVDGEVTEEAVIDEAVTGEAVAEEEIVDEEIGAAQEEVAVEEIVEAQEDIDEEILAAEETICEAEAELTVEAEEFGVEDLPAIPELSSDLISFRSFASPLGAAPSGTVTTLNFNFDEDLFYEIYDTVHTQGSVDSRLKQAFTVSDSDKSFYWLDTANSGLEYIKNSKYYGIGTGTDYVSVEKDYVFRIYLRAYGDVVFTSGIMNVLVNGKTPENLISYEYIADKNRFELYFSLRKATTPTGPSPIKEININVTAPQYEIESKGYTLNADFVSVTEFTWTSLESGNLTLGNEFLDETYSVVFKLTAESGYIFDAKTNGDYDGTVKINGNIANASLSNGVLTVSYEFEKLEKPTVISTFYYSFDFTDFSDVYNTSHTEGEISNVIAKAFSSTEQDKYTSNSFNIFLSYLNGNTYYGIGDGSNYFSESKNYKVDLRIHLEDGYIAPEDSSEIKVYVNNKLMTVRECDNDKYTMLVVIDVPVEQPIDIDSVEIDSLIPREGYAVTNSASCLTENCTIESAEWSTASGVKADGVFADETYTLTVKLSADWGYVFKTDASGNFAGTASICGKTATASLAGDILTVTYTFDKATVINTVNISINENDVYEIYNPNISSTQRTRAKVQTALRIATVTSDSTYSVDRGNSYLERLQNGIYVHAVENNTARVMEGTIYAFQINIAPNDGYTFTYGDESIQLYVNNGYVVPAVTIFNDDGSVSFTVVLKNFSDEGPLVPLAPVAPVTSINLGFSGEAFEAAFGNGNTVSAIENTLISEYNLTGSSVGEVEIVSKIFTCEVASGEWVKASDVSDKVSGNSDYAMEITIKPSAGKVFVNDLTRMSVKINGVAISDSDYSFKDGTLVLHISLGSPVLTDVEQFVDRCYTVILGRNPEEAGMQNWVNALNNGTNCGAQVAYGFIFSPEYLNKNKSDEEFVTDLYLMFFGRNPDAAGLNNWLNQLNAGVMTRLQVFAWFAKSPEYKNICEKYGILQGCYIPGYTTASQTQVNLFVYRLYNTCLGRNADIGGLENWSRNILAGNTSGYSAAMGFFTGPEYLSKNKSDEEFIKDLYVVMMDRTADAAGLRNWVNQLTVYSRAEVIQMFCKSPEYRNICARYGINVGV